MKFEVALKRCGKNFQAISKHVGTKNTLQVNSYSQKLLLRLEKNPELDGASEFIELLQPLLEYWTKEEE